MGHRDIWAVIRTERRALATDLGDVSAEQWSTPSLCQEWTVRDVLAHMTSLARVSPATFLPKLLSSRLSLSRLQQKELATARGASPSDTLTAFRSVEASKNPPGVPATMLGETFVHAEDIRRPLGIRHDYPTASAVRLADYFKASNRFIGTRERIAGLTLRATDADWSHGSGPEVSGPIMTLVMAMTGRKAVLGELTGDGVTELRARQID